MPLKKSSVLLPVPLEMRDTAHHAGPQKENQVLVRKLKQEQATV